MLLPTPLELDKKEENGVVVVVVVVVVVGGSLKAHAVPKS
jgi:hypothetical protein